MSCLEKHGLRTMWLKILNTQQKAIASNRKKRSNERTEGTLAYQSGIRAKCNLLPYNLHSIENCCKKILFEKWLFQTVINKWQFRRENNLLIFWTWTVSRLCKASFVFFCFNLFSLLLQPLRLWKWVSSITSYLNQMFQKRICYFDQLLNAN